MSRLKGERVASDMQRELGNILLLEAKDEDFKHVTITACEVTNDLSFAKIQFTTLDNREKVLHDLNNAAGFFRSKLAERLDIRHTPELKFIYDESIEYGQKIEKIIEELHIESDEEINEQILLGEICVK